MIYGVPCWNSFNWEDPGAILNSFRSTKGVNNHNDTNTVATVPLGEVPTGMPTDAIDRRQCRRFDKATELASGGVVWVLDVCRTRA